MKKAFYSTLFYVLAVYMLGMVNWVHAQQNQTGAENQKKITANLPPIFATLEALESNKDPKCHATATRLEYLIYGTPLTEQARYAKNDFQQQFVSLVWNAASKLTSNNAPLTKQHITQAVQQFVTIEPQPQEKLLRVEINNLYTVLKQRDVSHYASIAYSLRAILAVQQSQLLSLQSPWPPLTNPAVETLQYYTDVVSLIMLKRADAIARIANSHQVTEGVLKDVWNSLFAALPSQSVSVQAAKPTLTGSLKTLMATKIAAYQQYNQVNQALFARNFQVYFAHATLPSQQDKAEEVQYAFKQAVIGFAQSMYLLAQNKVGDEAFIDEKNVAQTAQLMLPHKVNEFEDVIYFPKYPRERQTIIESYDLDAFRDSGLHWIYLDFAIDELGNQYHIEADPFAAELLAETIAHFAVVLLRESGKLAKQRVKATEVTLQPQDIFNAQSKLEDKVNAYLNHKPEALPATQLVSSANTESYQRDEESYFTSAQARLNGEYVHRSSDWLSRQLRSYIKTGDTGNSTIPPAFGGAGIAAEDINNDGLTDVLILSGRGNALLLNQGGSFKDITKHAGLYWVRPATRLPGEPRQPLISDLDNDGLQDIIITYANDKHRVYKNVGEGKFKDVTDVANLGGEGLIGGPATLLDVNNDGLLDIYVTYFGNYLQGGLPTLARKNTNGTANQLFINQGNFTFQQASHALGADNTGWGQAVTHTDLNQDGWQDLIVGNDFGVNAYYINRQGKAFVDIAEHIGTDKPSYTMNIGLSDLNRDGMPDVYISNIVVMNKDEKYVLPSKDTVAKFNPDKLANMRVIEGNDLFLSRLDNKRIGYQLSDDVGRGHSSTGWAWDADFFDVDNDGDDDLYVTNGMNDYYVYSSQHAYSGEEVTFPDAGSAANVFFVNHNGKLNNVSQQSGLNFTANSRSAAYFDLENDGDLDVIVNNYHFDVKLFTNNAEQLNNNWITLKLVGSPENGISLDAIGAQIIVGYDDDGYVWRQVTSSQGYMSVHPKQQHIGLSKANEAKVAVIWPNGTYQAFGVLKANHRYVLTYGAQQ